MTSGQRSYVFRKTPSFDRQYKKLPIEQQKSCDDAFLIFKKDPWDSRFGTHTIQALSARYKKTVWSATIEGDLKVLFLVDGNQITSVGVGSHKIYSKR